MIPGERKGRLEDGKQERTHSSDIFCSSGHNYIYWVDWLRIFYLIQLVNSNQSKCIVWVEFERLSELVVTPDCRVHGKAQTFLHPQWTKGVKWNLVMVTLLVSFWRRHVSSVYELNNHPLFQAMIVIRFQTAQTRPHHHHHFEACTAPQKPTCIYPSRRIASKAIAETYWFC